MEEKKMAELSDEELDKAGGGGDYPYKMVEHYCPCCRKGTVAVPRYGSGTGQCTDCHTTFRSLDGKLLF